MFKRGERRQLNQQARSPSAPGKQPLTKPYLFRQWLELAHLSCCAALVTLTNSICLQLQIMSGGSVMFTQWNRRRESGGGGGGGGGRRSSELWWHLVSLVSFVCQVQAVVVLNDLNMFSGHWEDHKWWGVVYPRGTKLSLSVGQMNVGHKWIMEPESALYCMWIKKKHCLHCRHLVKKKRWIIF